MSIDFTQILSDPELKNMLREEVTTQVIDPWAGTYFERYVFLPSNTKGKYGEKFVKTYMKMMGSKVTPRVNTGHDCIIDGFKTEVKFSLPRIRSKMYETDSFVINRISKTKDWDRLIFVGINIDLSKSFFVWMTKKDFLANYDNLLYFDTQTKQTKDDYMVIGSRVLRFLNAPFTKHIYEWWGGEVPTPTPTSTLERFFT